MKTVERIVPQLPRLEKATRYEDQRFGEERALYGSCGVELIRCSFDGAEDGESALKEASDIVMEKGFCNLRYPFWHDARLSLCECEMTELCRAALWYSEEISIRNCKMHGIKALRECKNVCIEDSDIISPEFGWSTDGLCVKNTTASGEYFLLRAANVFFDHVSFQGKYSFQYVENAVLDDCELNTKDAFWHAKNVTVRNSVVRGEYLAWYSENLTLENCKIIGTQPFCYCKGLKLINCEMIDTDLAFERSEVEATVTTPILSIKNPRSGYISVPSVRELIWDDPLAAAQVKIG